MPYQDGGIEEGGPLEKEGRHWPTKGGGCSEGNIRVWNRNWVVGLLGKLSCG